MIPPHLGFRPCLRTARRRTCLVLLAAALAGCRPPGPPEVYRFGTNHDAPTAVACAARRLRVDGFEVAPVPADSTTSAPGLVAHRRTESRTGASEWWRIELSIVTDAEGRTLVETRAGASLRRDGAYVEPSTELQAAVGKVSAACTW